MVNISRPTVRKYIQLDEPPNKSSVRIINLCMFSEYLQHRIQEDPTVEVMQLWKEIREKGYNGSRTAVYEYLKDYSRQKRKLELIQQLPQIPSWAPSRVSILIYQKEERLSPDERRLIGDLKKRSDDIKTASLLAHKFRDMMENQRGSLLKDWIQEVLQTSIKELKSFAKGLLNDFQAVKNALTLPWSNGQVEGQINKLKTIKRQMYGRASFELLRKKMVLDYG